MNDVAKPTAMARPSVLSLNIKEKAALYAAYMPYLKNGGIFVPTAKPYNLGDEVYLLLSLMDDPSKFPIAGRVAWVTPQGAHNVGPCRKAKDSRQRRAQQRGTANNE